MQRRKKKWINSSNIDLLLHQEVFRFYPIQLKMMDQQVESDKRGDENPQIRVVLPSCINKWNILKFKEFDQMQSTSRWGSPAVLRSFSNSTDNWVLASRLVNSLNAAESDPCLLCP